MKSHLVDDPRRLSVLGADVRIVPGSFGEVITVTVVFRYSPWEPSPAQDVFFEQANALQCVRDVLDRGGMAEEL
jgi:hypothetical protein